MSDKYGAIFREGVWSNNVIFTQLLALCPTMAVTSTATNGLGMGLATTAVLVASNGMVAALRHWVSSEVRIPVYIVLIAALVTLVDMVLNAWFHDLYAVLGLFIALIVVNCAILGRAEAFASKTAAPAAMVDGLGIGVGFTLALMVVGGVREMIAYGTLFADAALLLGPAFKVMELRVIPDYGGFLLMALPPGGFLVLGFLIAGKRVLEERTAQRRQKVAARPEVA